MWHALVFCYWTVFTILYLGVLDQRFALGYNKQISKQEKQFLISLDILSLGCYTRFLCILTESCLQLAKITIFSIHLLYSIPSSFTECTNWPIDEVHISKPNWQQLSPVNISTYILYPFLFHVLTKSRDMRDNTS